MGPQASTFPSCSANALLGNLGRITQPLWAPAPSSVTKSGALTDGEAISVQGLNKGHCKRPNLNLGAKGSHVCLWGQVSPAPHP